MADHSNKSWYSRQPAAAPLCALALLFVNAITLAPDTAWSQRAQKSNPTQRPEAAEPATPVIEPTSTSGLDRALASCDKGVAVQEKFALPGIKGEVTLDRCYRGRAHLICVFTALATEAKSLTDSYVKIVNAKYPEISSVDGICQLNRESLVSDLAGSEEFTKRFAILKAHSETASKCVANVKQAFKDVVLTDMSQPPEILKSMIDSIDGDISKGSEAQNQISDLAAKMELSKKAMKTLEKIQRVMCVKEKAG